MEDSRHRRSNVKNFWCDQINEYELVVMCDQQNIMKKERKHTENNNDMNIHDNMIFRRNFLSYS